MRILTSFRCPTGTFMPAIMKAFTGGLPQIPNPESQIPTRSPPAPPRGDGGRPRTDSGFGIWDLRSFAPPSRPDRRLDEQLRDVLLRRLLEPLEARRRVHLDDHRTRRGLQHVDAGQVEARRRGRLHGDPLVDPAELHGLADAAAVDVRAELALGPDAAHRGARLAVDHEHADVLALRLRDEALDHDVLAEAPDRLEHLLARGLALREDHAGALGPAQQLEDERRPAHEL